MRLWARLRAIFPLTAVLPALILGQLASLLGPAPAALLSGCMVGLIAAKMLPKFRIALWCSVSGAVSAFAPTPEFPRLASSQPYLAQLLTTADRPRVGALKLKVAILAERVRTLDYQPISPQPKVLCRAVDLPWRNVTALQAGAVFLLQGSFRSLEANGNPFSYDAMLVRHGFSHTCKIRWASAAMNESQYSAAVMRRAIRQFVYSKIGNNEASGLLLAMSIGARNLVSDETEQAFKRTGLAHLLVASGYQVMLVFSIVTYGAHFFLGWIGRSRSMPGLRLIAAALGLLAAGAFVVIVGPEASIVRALCAGIFSVLALSLERGGHPFNGVLFSLVCMSLLWPGCYLETSVQLTFAALAGLSLANPSGGAFVRYSEACALACLATSIVSLAWFGTVSVWTCILNPVLAPLGSLLGCLGGLLALVLCWSGIDSSGWGLWLAARALCWFRDWVAWFADVPYTSLLLEGWQRWAADSCLFLVFVYILSLKAIRFKRKYSL